MHNNGNVVSITINVLNIPVTLALCTGMKNSLRINHSTFSLVPRTLTRTQLSTVIRVTVAKTPQGVFGLSATDGTVVTHLISFDNLSFPEVRVPVCQFCLYRPTNHQILSLSFSTLSRPKYDTCCLPSPLIRSNLC